MIVHQVVKQRNDTDCGVATLTMLLSEKGITYEDVLVAVAKVDKSAGKNGLYQTTMIKAAAELGVVLKRKRKYDLDEVEAGILTVYWPRNGGAHVVFIRDGQLTDTDGLVWDPQTYLATKQATPRSLLVMEE